MKKTNESVRSIRARVVDRAVDAGARNNGIVAAAATHARVAAVMLECRTRLAVERFGRCCEDDSFIFVSTAKHSLSISVVVVVSTADGVAVTV